MNQNEIEKFSLDSMNIKEEQISQLKQLFPEVFTEGNKIDWERLRLTFGENIDVGKERFGLNWAGKSECFKLIQQPSTGTLVPSREESINFDTTENLFIEGDNLEVLKLLQKSYFGKVKMIYIDPPYNTGNDFVYIDDFKDNLKNYLELTGQVDSEGKKLSTNVESDGRFHSNWLNMMYPRLFLAKNLLREDGTIFISIDDRELNNLTAICKEIFGEDNFLATLIWEKVHTRKNSTQFFSVSHDYVIAFAKDKSNWDRILIPRDNTEAYTNPDNDPKGPWKSDPITAHNFYAANYKITKPNGIVLERPRDRYWVYSQETWQQKVEANEVIWGEGNSMPLVKRYLSSVQNGLVPITLFSRKFAGDSALAKGELSELLGVGALFDYPKPHLLIKRCMQITLREADFALDFFAGSCTTAHAVLELNKEDGGNRKFICVQIPEPTDEASEAFKAGYKTIADIGKERIRRVIKKIEAEKEKQEPDMFEGEKKPQDLGFKVFKLKSSNFATWDANVEKNVDALTEQLFKHVDHISPAAEQEAILYELLLKAGFELTTEITNLMITDKRVYSVLDNALLICLERNLTHELLKAIAQLKPVRFICLDEGFRDNDQLKSNAVLLMKENGVQKFQTV